MPPREVTMPADVPRQWLAWLDAGQPELVRADLANLLDAYRARYGELPDPPSSAGPAISTR